MGRFTSLTVVTVFTAVLCHCVADQISCRNEKGDPVDWFIVYKLVHNRSSPDPYVRDGLGYMYLDADQQQWRRGVAPINETAGAVFSTLQQIYSNHKSPDVGYVLYNDETPEKNESASHGHTKGDICFDKQQGYWLVHSVPRFPDYSDRKYTYPTSGTHYGQTFLCMTLAYEFLDVIGWQLLYNHPQVYDFNLPSTFTTQNPALKDAVIDDAHINEAPWNRLASLKTLGGQVFRSYAKYNKYGEDLYAAWVAPSLASGLLTETWRNGGHVMPTNCSSDLKVYNIQAVEVNGEAFPETEDHSKWALTTDPSKPWICIGDINRMMSQESRGGGTVCTLLPQVWKAFNSSVTRVEGCPKAG